MEDYNSEKIVRNEELACIDSSYLHTLIHRSIGSLTFLNGMKRMTVGTGTVIAPDLVFTAAHNFYDKQSQGQHEDFKFYLGANGVVNDDYIYEVDSWIYLNDFKACPNNGRRSQFDYALFKLKKPVSFKQFPSLSLTCEKCLMENNKQARLQIYGFPDSCGNNFVPLDQFGDRFQLHQYGQARKNRIIFIKLEIFTIAYAISTLPGQSGTGVCVDNNIIAIHIGGGKHGDYNIGRILTPELLDNLQIWRKQLNGKPFSRKEKQPCSHSNQIELKSRIGLQSSEIEELRSCRETQARRIQELQRLLRIANQLNQKLIPQQIMAELEKTKNQSKLCLNAKGLFVINVSKHFNLKELYLYDNKLSAIELGSNVNLTQLWLQNNQIQSIDLTKNIELTDLRLWQNQLTQIDLRHNSKLVRLGLFQNQLSRIDLSKNVELTGLQLSRNQLLQIDLSHNKYLRDLRLSQNQLAHINLQVNTELKELFMPQNRLTFIDLSKNIKLNNLNLAQNQLNILDLSKNPRIENLWLHQNSLGSTVFWYHAQLYDLRLEGQRSIDCQVTLTHRKGEDKNCLQWGKANILKYNSSKEGSCKKLCRYIIKTIQRN